MAKKKHLSETRTEDSILDLLNIQGWLLEKPPKGALVRQNEYQAFPELEQIFKGKSKSGQGGHGYPDFLLVDRETRRPLMVIEAKADESDLSQSLDDACWYGDACREASHTVLAVGVAGQEKTQIRIAVRKYRNGAWEQISYEGKGISWIPTPDDIANLLAVPNLLDLHPKVPSPEVLAEKADLINRLLREAAIKDEYRPAYIGAMMLALWQTKGKIRKDPEFVLHDINTACHQAFSKSHKPELAESLQINEANQKLARSAWRILATLEKLNVVTAAFDHDYLGQLYETFFRYTGGNTIGQYFTPRHITRLMADICQTTPQDDVIDPACGTGGFLIACIQRAREILNAKYEDVIEMVRNSLIGYESEPLTAALCIANMILRGDGTSGIRNMDVFVATDYPVGNCNIALMNPPFPHKKTDVPPQRFVERALEALKTRGKLAVILPTSLVVKKEHNQWRRRILKDSTLLAVCELPDELFQPFASSTTCAVILEKGVPHDEKQKTVFVRIAYDGLTLKKGTRVSRLDGKNYLPDAVDAVLNKTITPGFSGVANLSGGMEWAPGAYIPSGVPTESELKESIDELLRRYVSFYIRYAPEIARQRQAVESGELQVKDYRDLVSEARLKNAEELGNEPDTIGAFFDILYGQKELHSREGIPPGDSLIISPTERYNGTYGWLSFEPLLKPPFVTVAQTGSIGEAFVQSEPCGVNDDCLVLLPKNDLSLPDACLSIAAATIRLERWRFSYGRKLTPSRISDFRMSRMPQLETWVEDQLKKWQVVAKAAIQVYK
jgi:type I restriction enzyme M protein